MGSDPREIVDNDKDLLSLHHYFQEWPLNMCVPHIVLGKRDKIKFIDAKGILSTRENSQCLSHFLPCPYDLPLNMANIDRCIGQ